MALVPGFWLEGSGSRGLALGFWLYDSGSMVLSLGSGFRVMVTEFWL